jgi:hypothetical protein
MGSAHLRAVIEGVVCGATFLVMVRPSEANHYRFMIDNSSRWNPDGVTLRGINLPWIAENDTYAVCSDWAQLPQEIVAAIGDWEAVLPELQFHLFCTSGPILDIQLESVSGVDICRPLDPACYDDTYVSGGALGGRYGGAPVITFNDDADGFEFTVDGRRVAMSHELGHVFGLDEAYCDNPSPPATPAPCTTPAPNTTIMNCVMARDIPGPKDEVYQSCSGGAVLGPTISDGDDVRLLYDHEQATEVTSADLHSDAVIQFKDFNWAETEYSIVVRVDGTYVTEFSTIGPAGRGFYPPQVPGANPMQRSGFLWDKSEWSQLAGNYEFCVYAGSAVYPSSSASACTYRYLYPDDVDGDGFLGQDEFWHPLCRKFGSGGFADLDRDDDGDGAVNDGCGAAGNAETGSQCANNINDEPASDPLINDGCPFVGTVSEGGYGIVTIWNDGCSFYNPNNAGWPLDFVQGGTPDSTYRVTITDITSFIAPIVRFGTSPPNANFSPRWDLLPGRGGIFTDWVNIQDLTSTFAGPTAYPPMLGGVRALDGPACVP